MFPESAFPGYPARQPRVFTVLLLVFLALTLGACSSLDGAESPTPSDDPPEFTIAAFTAVAVEPVTDGEPLEVKFSWLIAAAGELQLTCTLSTGDASTLTAAQGDCSGSQSVSHTYASFSTAFIPSLTVTDQHDRERITTTSVEAGNSAAPPPPSHPEPPPAPPSEPAPPPPSDPAPPSPPPSDPAPPPPPPPAPPDEPPLPPSPPVPPPDSPPPPSAPPPAATLMLDLVNAARAQARQCGDTVAPAAPPLVWDERLGAAAQLHSEYMAETKQMTHAGRNGSTLVDRVNAQGYRLTAVGENVAYGYPGSSSVMAAWLDSPGHCRNLMNPVFTDFGAGVALSANGVRYWTQNFGRQ